MCGRYTKRSKVHHCVCLLGPLLWLLWKFEPPHDKTKKWHVRTAKTQICLGVRPVWSESSLSAWSKLGSLATHWTHSEDADQTGRIPRLIWVFAGRTVILLVLSWGGSFGLFEVSLEATLLRKSSSPVSTHVLYLNHVMRKPVLAICEQQKCRPACASAQSDQHFCCLLLRQYNTYTC